VTGRWELLLPYSSPPLSLNQRLHHMQRSRLTRQLRDDVALLAKARRIPRLGRVRVELHYQPKDNRHRDADNLVATLKPCIDGLRDAGVIPDDTPEYVTWGAPQIHPKQFGVQRVWLVVLEEVLVS
jgi:crossover junction endodeoxyribonuclease RusA